MTASWVRPMEHTGRSGNIAYYAERGRPSKFLQVKVARSELHPGSFYVTVSRDQLGQLFPTLVYEPARRQRPGPLPAATVTQLVREFFAQRYGGG